MYDGFFLARVTPGSVWGTGRKAGYSLCLGWSYLPGRDALGLGGKFTSHIFSLAILKWVSCPGSGR